MLELERESKRSEIVNKVKAIHASYEEKAKEYELAIVKLRAMEDEYSWDKIRYESGLISKLMLTGTEVKYLQALTAKIEAGYDYYLVKQELALAQEGVFMPDDYANLKNSF
jgi:histone acetyltransferase (RNA polymerase elongator complex component)